MKVFAVGCLQIDTSENSQCIIKTDRLWALYKNFEDAEKAMIENHGDMFESNYNYGLIEEIYVIEPKISDLEISLVPKEFWYKATFNKETNPIIYPCDKPKCLDGVVKFWVG